MLSHSHPAKNQHEGDSALPWNYAGNGIIDELLNDKQYAQAVHIIDAVAGGNIIEIDNPHPLPQHRYLDFYFTLPQISIDDILKKSTYGIISLHNSWTPEIYKKASLADIIQSKDHLLLSHLLISLCQQSGDAVNG